MSKKVVGGLFNQQTLKKGFTLVELLAVIVIIGILATIGTITVTKIISSSENKALVEEGINLAAAGRYAYENNDSIVNESKACLSLETLYETGYFEKGSKDNYYGSVLITKAEKGALDITFWIKKDDKAIEGKSLTVSDKDVIKPKISKWTAKEEANNGSYCNLSSSELGTVKTPSKEDIDDYTGKTPITINVTTGNVSLPDDITNGLQCQTDNGGGDCPGIEKGSAAEYFLNSCIKGIIFKDSKFLSSSGYYDCHVQGASPVYAKLKDYSGDSFQIIGVIPVAKEKNGVPEYRVKLISKDYLTGMEYSQDKVLDGHNIYTNPVKYNVSSAYYMFGRVSTDRNKLVDSFDKFIIDYGQYSNTFQKNVGGFSNTNFSGALNKEYQYPLITEGTLWKTVLNDKYYNHLKQQLPDIDKYIDDVLWYTGSSMRSSYKVNNCCPKSGCDFAAKANYSSDFATFTPRQLFNSEHSSEYVPYYFEIYTGIWNSTKGQMGSQSSFTEKKEAIEPIKSKIGLMYASDFYSAYEGFDPDAKINIANTDSNEVEKVLFHNWLFKGPSEHTMSLMYRDSEYLNCNHSIDSNTTYSQYASSERSYVSSDHIINIVTPGFKVYDNYNGTASGQMHNTDLNDKKLRVGETKEEVEIRPARPVFYLNKSIQILKGSGSSQDPYVLGFK